MSAAIRLRCRRLPVAWRSLAAGTRSYFASDARRALQTALGVFWLLDGALQFQSFMYSRGFPQMLAHNAAGQPHWLASTINWAADTLGAQLTLLNTFAALAQVAIGLGLLYRRSVKPALVLSFGWSLVVWWVGEGFGQLFANSANPLTGAPGAVLLYALIGLLAWPSERPAGLLSVRAARITWGVLWLSSGWLWLLTPNSTANATHDAIVSAPSGAAWLTTVQRAVAEAARGHGLIIAVVLAFASAAIGVAVAINWRPRLFLAAAIALNLVYWVLGQGFGGILTGQATDPNAAPLVILLAGGLLALAPIARSERCAITLLDATLAECRDVTTQRSRAFNGCATSRGPATTRSGHPEPSRRDLPRACSCSRATPSRRRMLAG